MLSPNVDAALDALRPLSPFGSGLGQILHTHITRMRALGYRYDTEAPGCCASTASCRGALT
ncbi:MAG: hypothetical protein ACRD2X_25540 [Vicinamibacteraceae bacterium]